MAGFLTGPAAHLVGAGMQAIGVGIPVGQTSAKLIDGMRDVGIPVPPKSWFKRKGSKDDPEIVGSNIKASKSPKKNVYDKLEEHIHGVIQVVRPVIELKQMVREGCCKSADRAKRADRSPSPSRDQRLKYYTPQKCSSGYCENDFVSRGDSAYPSQKRKAASKKSASRRKDSTDDDADELDGAAAAAPRKSCIYCSRSKRLLELPCGGVICSKCDETEDHEQESKMPRRIRNLRSSKNERVTELIPDQMEPVDIIDLTQDSPMNTALRLSRARAGHNPEEIAIEQDQSEGDSVILTYESDSTPMAKKPKLKPAVIINLDETVSLDDNLNNTPNQNTVSPRKPGLNCPICLESLANENIKAMTTPCGHVYCLECLKKVTTEKKKCSLCQRPISFARCIRLHI
ncbi:uncharacterized protein LOC100680139 [Nasonia vitripennis]|uniref:RING-type domain-containing protein n=1 Tax=Nasonia vitripennis TaxID=7425 RepID=A0A7M7HA48_NASVI|nr:uncharacterized protein LOC100680139 [Nasonia vitripennis]